MNKIIQLFSLLAIATLLSCQNNHSSGTINQTIPVDEFETKLNDKSIQLLDVRTPEEFSSGHLVGATNTNINSGNFETEVAQLDKNKPVLVYCLSGGRSAEAADILTSLGFKEVYNMQGGIMKWTNANKPLDNRENVATTEETGMTEEDFTNALKTEKLVLVDYNAKWCKPCVKMLPMLKTLTENKKDKMILLSIDADANKTLLAKKGISGIPYLELYKNGELVWKHEGEIEESQLLKETNL